MGGQPPKRPIARRALLPVQVDDAKTQHALRELGDEVARLGQLNALDRQVVTVDLVVGTNKVNHGLGRRVRGYTLTPTVADATFAHALVIAGNSQPDRQVWISVIGVNQPGAVLEVW